MSKKTFTAAILILAFLISTVAGLFVVNVAKADPYLFVKWGPPVPGASPPGVEIYSPKNNTIYSSCNISLSYNITQPLLPGELPGATSTGITHISYTLDNVITSVYFLSSWSSNLNHGQYGISNSALCLPLDVSDGNHSLTLHAIGLLSPFSDGFWLDNSSTVFFTVDTVAPNISILIGNGTHHEGRALPLHFKVDEPTSWMGYSLDDAANVSITGNTALAGLTMGSHDLTVYANDTAGNMGKSDTIFFTMDTSTPSPFPLFLGIAVFVIVLFAVAILLAVYFRRTKKHKRLVEQISQVFLLRKFLNGIMGIIGKFSLMISLKSAQRRDFLNLSQET